jgi:DNA-directed RNA polymerase specialized sigma24 family protein
VQGEDHVREVYGVSYGRLVAQIFAICGDQHEAEDVVQDAFANALIHSARFRSVDNPEAWLRTVALNLLRSRWRRVMRWRRLMPSLPGLAAEGTVKSRLVKGRDLLASLLAEDEETHHA